jgi:glycosyltransferase involved in cell wall biosynthesis
MSYPRRVLHAVNRMDRGGIETFLMRIYRQIDRSKIQFDFFAHDRRPGAYDDEIRRLGGRVYVCEFELNPFKLPGYIIQVKSFFESHTEYQIVHAHLNAFNGIFLLAAEWADIPNRLAHIHTKSSGSILRAPLWNLIKIVGRGAYTERYACSKKAGIWAYGRILPYSIIENGIPLELFRFDQVARTQTRKKYGLCDRLIIGHVGAFRKEKNQIFLIDVLHEVRRQREDTCLLLVGSGVEQPGVAAKVRELGLEEHVVFTGEITDVAKYYSAMDVFALPSIAEGLGIVAIEAQASGLPSVLSTGVPPEAMASGLASRLPLNGNSNVKQWAAAVVENSNRINERSLVYPEVAGFDIAKTTMQLQKSYLGLHGDTTRS